MAQYDGSIKINTVIDTKQATGQVLSLENKIVKTADKIVALKDKMSALGTAKIPTSEYTEIQNQLEKATVEFDKLLARQEKMQELGGEKGTAWKSLQYDIEQVSKTIEFAEGELKDLIDTGKAFTLGSGTEDYSKLSHELQTAEAEMQTLLNQHEELVDKQNQVGTTGKKAFESVNKSARKTGSLLKTIASRFKGLALSLLIFNQIRKGFRALTDGIKEGFQNLVQYSDSYNKSVSELMSANTQLKNSLATAFQPIVEKIIPYLVKLINYITEAVNKVTQLFAALSGKSTWTRAVAVQEDYAKSLAKSAKSAKKLLSYLSPIDEINRFTSKEEDKEETEISAKDMFEEVPVDTKILEWLDKIKEKLQPIIDYMKKLGEVFKGGFFDGLGDYQYRIDMIKDALKSISQSLIDIWTDPEVLAAADKWLQSVANLLGTLVGSLASIGLSIAANLLSGIALYLEENKDRIKKHLISMFDIWADINDLLAEGMSSIAYILESLASENAVRLTTNLIGIANEIIMGVSEVVSKLVREALNIVLKPIIDNKEAFKQAFENLFGVLATVAGTIKDALASTFDTINQVYDEHLKPFFDSVAQGFSDIVGKVLVFFNETLIPALQRMAENFDTLWKEHIQPFVDKLVEFFGKIADLLTVLWEKYLKPLVEWIVENILPVLVPILETIWNVVSEVLGYIFDALGGLITVLGGIIDFLTGIFSGDWDKAWQGISDIAQGFFDLIVNSLKGFVSLLLGIVETLITALKSLVEASVKTFMKTIDVFIEFIKKAIEGIKDFVTNGIKKMLDDTKTMWENGWNSIVDFFSGIWDRAIGIVSGAFDFIKNTVQSIIEWVQKAIDKISSIGSTIGGAFSGVSGLFGFNVQGMSGVTGYAQGTVIPATHGEFLARVGDNNRETEVISPISVIRQAVAEELKGLNLSGGIQNADLHVRIGDIAVTQAAIRGGKIIQTSTGLNPLYDL